MAVKAPRMTPVLFHILLSLAKEAKHGYAILGEIAERTGGRLEVGASTLYYSIGRLEDAGVIERTDTPSDDAGPHGEQRRPYTLTEEGRDLLQREIGVLASIVEHARAAGVEPRPVEST